ncbi:MAG: competence/damage-inducible protein A [Acidimicrobiia bacterium]
MRCEVVAIGTELLLGTVVDSNSAWIGQQLALAGIDCLRSVRVGDNHDRMVAALRESLERADAVICCGGLGPTQDDVTREAIAEVMGVGLRRDDAVADVIRELFAARGRRMPDNNLRQADVPEGATVIPQTRGTAPGLICPVGPGGDDSAKVVYAVPGVPHEMQDMVRRAVVPDLRRRAGDTSTIVSRTLRTWGESESGLAELLDGRIRALDEAHAAGRPAPTLAFNASGIEGIRVRITARGADEADAAALVTAEEAELRSLLGDLVFGVDDESMEHAIGTLLLERGLTLGLAESVTGGLVASRIVSVPGASRWFRGSVVSYATEVKLDVLGVPDGPVVSEEAAAAMAAGARRVLGADVGLGVTGVAGPEEQDGQPVGTVFLATDVSGDVEVRRVQLPGDRERVRQYAAISLLDTLRRRLIAG